MASRGTPHLRDTWAPYCPRNYVIGADMVQSVVSSTLALLLPIGMWADRRRTVRRSIDDQQRVLMAFCDRIVADAEAKDIVVEADLTGMVQNRILPGFLAGLSDSDLPEHDTRVARPFEAALLRPQLRFRCA